MNEGKLNAADLIMLAGQCGGIMWRVKEVVMLVPELSQVCVQSNSCVQTRESSDYGAEAPAVYMHQRARCRRRVESRGASSYAC